MIMRCFQHGIEQDGSEVTVAERRLLVGAFNFLAEKLIWRIFCV